ncbi:MAG: nucleotidyltransferase [Verrucomicrobia bacterium]|nr:nucleotidyltransferase [Verrucomicrobiota bacterium]
MKTNFTELKRAVEHPFPLLFVTVSGAHLYGFPSEDSDYDLRGVHMLPIDDVFGLEPGKETVESSKIWEGLEIDLVTHDAKKFFKLLLKKNGYVLEQLFSPLVVQTTQEHDELKSIARKCITKFHAHHYLGFSETQWNLFLKESPPRVKPLLYVYRVLLTGIHLMRTWEIEANLVNLNKEFRLPYINDLISRKLSQKEQSTIGAPDIEFHRKEYERLTILLEAEMDKSALPEAPNGRRELNDLLIRIRRSSFKEAK